MEAKKLAVIFPGIGYHRDKPLLYYAAKLAQSRGYEILQTEYHDMPLKIRGNTEMMQAAAVLTFQQTAEQLKNVDWNAYDSILFIGKSIGTIAAAKYAAEHPISVQQLWYTPLHATFSFAPVPTDSCIAFLGDADPWSDVSQLRADAAAQQIPLHLYPGCNHSLECTGVLHNIDHLREIMQITADFMR